MQPLNRHVLQFHLPPWFCHYAVSLKRGEKEKGKIHRRETHFIKETMNSVQWVHSTIISPLKIYREIYYFIYLEEKNSLLY